MSRFEKAAQSHGLTVIRGGRVEGEVVVRPELRYRSFSTPELMEEITRLVQGIEGGLNRIDQRDLRQRLLPALHILRGRIAHGHWEEFLLRNRLNPATVRKWRARERVTTQDLLQALGESPPKPQLKRKAGTMAETAAVQLAKAGERLARAVVKRDFGYAMKLARSYLEACEEIKQ